MMAIHDRFFAKVDKNGPISILGTRCWQWTAATDDQGYGHFRAAGRTVRAHRLVIELTTDSPVPSDLDVDHRCHNESCVNPQHLRVGTTKENTEDRLAANRNSGTGVRGVGWHKATNRWRAQVGHHHRRIHVGLFDTLEEAESAVIAKRLELFTNSDLTRR